MKEGVCRLCLENRPLIKQSHIIPEFMFKRLMSTGDQAFLKGYKDKFSPDPKFKPVQTGLFEKHILCSRCDNEIIGSFENYASRVLSNGPQRKRVKVSVQHHVTEKGTSFFRYSNIDYAQFKLFLLSLIWKSSVSSNEMFESVKLGPHEEVIRNMIVNGNPGKEGQYPVNILKLSEKSNVPTQFIEKPICIKTEAGHRVYRYTILGNIYLFYVSGTRHKLPTNVVSQSILMSNHLNMLEIPPNQTNNYVDMLLKPLLK